MADKMETKRLIVGILIAMALVMGYQVFITQLAKRQGWDKPPSQVRDQKAATTAATTGPSPTEAVRNEPPTRPQLVAATTLASKETLLVTGAMEAKAATLGSAAKEDKLFSMALALSPRGAGVDWVVLNEFLAEAGQKRPYIFQEPYSVQGGAIRALATESVSVDGASARLENVLWKLEDSSADSATYSVEIQDAAGSKLLRVTKTYTLGAKKSKSLGYELSVTHQLQNLSGRELKVKLALGGVLPPQSEEDYFGRQIIAGYWDDGIVRMDFAGVGDFGEKQPSRDFIKSKGQAMVWAGASSVYFDAIIRPLPLEGTKVPMYLERAAAKALNPSSQVNVREVAMTLATAELAVEAGGNTSLTMEVFFGPKKRSVLNSDYYRQSPRSYSETLKTSSGCCGWLTFGWLVNILVGMLLFFRMVLRDWGLAIIALVVVVRVALHPVTKRSTINMQKMGKMGPEVERLRKKYGENKEELNKAMMGFYKEQGATPVMGCLPMFLQMPIWLALWSCLQSTFELRHEPFLFGVTWIKDLAQPDRLAKFATPIPLVLFSVREINLLPILLAGVFYLQSMFQPKPETETKEQAQQRKMMQWMSLLFPIFMYSMPSGLILYILTSTGLGIIESKRIRDHIKAQQEAEKAGKVIVDAKPTRASRLGKDDKVEHPKRGGLMGWLAGLQAKAEQMRRDVGGKK